MEKILIFLFKYLYILDYNKLKLRLIWYILYIVLKIKDTHLIVDIISLSMSQPNKKAG